ncbi:MAG: hypothetical protein WBA93_34360 [Microcoleaceae cyanobacterium]
MLAPTEYFQLSKHAILSISTIILTKVYQNLLIFLHWRSLWKNRYL